MYESPFRAFIVLLYVSRRLCESKPLRRSFCITSAETMGREENKRWIHIGASSKKSKENMLFYASNFSFFMLKIKILIDQKP